MQAFLSQRRQEELGMRSASHTIAHAAPRVISSNSFVGAISRHEGANAAFASQLFCHEEAIFLGMSLGHDATWSISLGRARRGGHIFMMTSPASFLARPSLRPVTP